MKALFLSSNVKMKVVLAFAVFTLVITTIHCKPQYYGGGSLSCYGSRCQAPCPNCPQPCPPVNCPPPPLPCPPVTCPPPCPTCPCPQGGLGCTPPPTNCNVCNNYGSVGMCCPPNSFTPWYQSGTALGGGYPSVGGYGSLPGYGGTYPSYGK